MAKYFIGSVGMATASRLVNGSLQVAFVSKTLTDSGINISTSKDDIRAGTGAPVVTSFTHDPSIEITLTDVMFKPEYIEAQLGADFVANGEAYQTETVTSASTSYTLDKIPLSISLGCDSDAYRVVWYAEKGSDDWSLLELPSATQEITLPKAGTYCVRYLAQDDRARVATITTNIIPQELFLVIEAPLFAGDACAASNASTAGVIQFEIPRFKLNGSQDFSMAMSSNTTLSLSGIALATEDSCDPLASTLMKIRDVRWNREWFNDAKTLAFDPTYLADGETVKVYAIYKNGTTAIVKNSELAFTITGTNNTVSEAGLLHVESAGTIAAAYADAGLASGAIELDYQGE